MSNTKSHAQWNDEILTGKESLDMSEPVCMVFFKGGGGGYIYILIYVYFLQDAELCLQPFDFSYNFPIT